ncbi:ABC transporter ATPase [Polaribacter sejongensis]|uniref:ABC transporter ATPase n=1 Tax=Polaribacter sejongensis TaxID=985043 RepID=A0AAJ1VGA9_9FLAO|nr:MULTISPECIES: ABC transporter ATPase [Polaribacter]AUC21013.1 ABC transporter ATPase [Polaribacter sejongensis]MDN3619648.1 ABC transporter ATPase [Polaribacter undariae]UWD31416.1 ABC transporter ATPase [Polaribacter undariae]
MFVDYSTITEDAKVWVYPSSRKFYPNEIEGIESKVKDFLESWKSDDENFKASYQFLYNRFIVFFADDENSTLTNSDIDASVSFILGLQQEYEVELLDKMNACFKQGEYVQYKDLKDFKKLLKNKAVTAKSIIFDNLITTKVDFDNNWEIPLEESWYNRYL